MEIAPNDINENLECNSEFLAETEVRAKRIKCKFDYEEGVKLLTEQNIFKINFFNL